MEYGLIENKTMNRDASQLGSVGGAGKQMACPGSLDKFPLCLHGGVCLEGGHPASP